MEEIKHLTVPQLVDSIKKDLENLRHKIAEQHPWSEWPFHVRIGNDRILNKLGRKRMSTTLMNDILFRLKDDNITARPSPSDKTPTSIVISTCIPKTEVMFTYDQMVEVRSPKITIID